MNLYTNRDSNIRKTWFLMTGFLVFVIAIGWVFSEAYGNSSILVFAVVFSILMSALSYWNSDKIILAITGAKEVKPDENPELYRIVENLAITAGLPTPKIYITPEAAPNAFATGRDPKHAVVAVTQGLLQRLNKTELEGVIAHELSHVGNRDILLNSVVVILVGFIALLADFFRRSLFFGGMRRRNNNGGEAGAIFLIVAIVLSILAPLSAMLIQLAISRKREFLADSSGALLTRYPEGLISALEKISKDPTPMQHVNSATAHLWLVDPTKKVQKTSWFAKLFMNHPPIEDRIKALEGIKI